MARRKNNDTPIHRGDLVRLKPYDSPMFGRIKGGEAEVVQVIQDGEKTLYLVMLLGTQRNRGPLPRESFVIHRAS